MWHGVAEAMFPGGPEGGGGGGFAGIVPLLALFVIFYFLLIRPQQRKQRLHRDMIEKVKKGDRVLTSGGIYGVVTKVKDQIVSLEIASNVRVEVSKSAISSVMSREASSSSD